MSNSDLETHCHATSPNPQIPRGQPQASVPLLLVGSCVGLSPGDMRSGSHARTTLATGTWHTGPTCRDAVHAAQGHVCSWPRLTAPRMLCTQAHGTLAPLSAGQQSFTASVCSSSEAQEGCTCPRTPRRLLLGPLPVTTELSMEAADGAGAHWPWGELQCPQERADQPVPLGGHRAALFLTDYHAVDRRDRQEHLHPGNHGGPSAPGRRPTAIPKAAPAQVLSAHQAPRAPSPNLFPGSPQTGHRGTRSPGPSYLHGWPGAGGGGRVLGRGHWGIGAGAGKVVGVPRAANSLPWAMVEAGPGFCLFTGLGELRHLLSVREEPPPLAAGGLQARCRQLWGGAAAPACRRLL